MRIFDKMFTILYSLLLIIVPLVMFHKTSELFEFNKMIAIYFITLLIVSVWVIKMIVYKKIIIKKSAFDIPIIIFLISQILSTIFSIDTHTSLFGYYGRFNGGLLSLIAYVLLYYGYISNMSFSSLIKLLHVSMGTALFVFLWGIPGKIGSDLSCLLFTGNLTNECWTDQFDPAARMFSTLGQPNWLASYLAVHMMIALVFCIYRSKPYRTGIWYGFLSICFFVGILFTRSRSSLLSVVIVCCVIGSMYAIQRMRKKYVFSRMQQYSLLALVVLIIGSVLLFKTGIPLVDRYISVFKKSVEDHKKEQNNSNITASSVIRKIVWRGAAELGFRYPFFGTGVETFAYAYYFTRPMAHNLTSEWDFIYNKAHNEYLNFFATTGVIGIVSYLLLIISIGWYGVRYVVREKPTHPQWIIITALITGWMTLLIANFFGFSTTTINLFFYLIPAWIITVTVPTSHDKKNTLSFHLVWYQWILIVVVCVSVGSGTYYIYRYVTADLYFAKASSLFDNQKYDEALKTIQNASRLKKEHVYDDKASTIASHIAFLLLYQDETKLGEEFVSLADSYQRRARVSSPLNVLYLKNAAKNYFLFYEATQKKEYILQAHRFLSEAVSLSPTDPKLPYTNALFYSSEADKEKDEKIKRIYQKAALGELEHALYLKHDYQDALMLKEELGKKYET